MAQLIALVLGQIFGGLVGALIIHLIWGGPLDRFRDRH